REGLRIKKLRPSGRGVITMDVWAENVLRSRAGIEAQEGALSLGIQGGAACGSDNMSSFFAQISARYSF
ncbi:hypothetical protein, partial [Sutterella wadsworthensis]|uniref:hypothetical protein n=2 Tax=Sutterella wadsworthensis TaxID=40545 RepID=UPI00266BE610